VPSALAGFSLFAHCGSATDHQWAATVFAPQDYSNRNITGISWRSFTQKKLDDHASRIGGGSFWPVLMGTGAMTLRAAAIKRVRPIPLLFLLVGVTAWLGH
jgi:hypothetical protein